MPKKKRENGDTWRSQVRLPSHLMPLIGQLRERHEVENLNMNDAIIVLLKRGIAASPELDGEDKEGPCDSSSS